LRLGECERLGGWVVFPTDDESAAMLARNHAALSRRYRLTVPPWELLRWAYDKRLTYELAARAGVAVPRTRVSRGPGDLADLPSGFPLVLKPAFKRDSNRFTEDKAWQVSDEPELAERHQEACELIGPELVMLQEFVPGRGETQFSFAALCDDGEPLAWVVARRSRQYPLDFGHSSSFVETVEEPEVEASARRVLAEARYSGLVEVEFKRHQEDGDLKLLDVNPRSWTWHTIGRPAGVDFAYLAWRLALGDRPAPVRGAAGVRWVYMATDMPAAVAAMRRGQLAPRAYLASLRRPLEFAVLARDDLLPLAAGPLRAYRVGRRSLARRSPSK